MMASWFSWLVRWSVSNQQKPLNSEGSNHLTPATWICLFGAGGTKIHNITPPEMVSQMVMNPS